MTPRSNRLLTVLALFLAGAATAHAQLELTLEDAVARGLATDHGLEAVRSRREAADASHSAAQMARLPEVTLTGTYARIEEQEPLTIPTAGGTTTLGNSFSDVTSVELSLMQPLFLGGRLSAQVDQRASLSRAAQFDGLWRRTAVKLDLQRAYWKLLEARQRRDAFAERLDQVQENLATMERRYGEGLVTRNQVLTVEMRRAEAELELMEAENALAIAGADLAVRVGEDPGASITPTSELPERPDPPPALDVLLSRGLAERPDLLGLRERLTAQGAGIALARSSLYPELFVTGNYTYARPNEAVFPAPDRFEDSWRVGLMGRITLGSVPATLYRAEEAEALRRAQHHSLAAAEEQARLEIRRAFLALQSSRRRVDLGETMVRQAEENLANTAVRLDNGTALNEDLLDAQVDLLEARLVLTSATVQRELAWLQVMYLSATES